MTASSRQPPEGAERVTPAVARALTQATAALAGAGVPSPRTDAELLAAHVLGVPRSRLLLTSELDAEQGAELAELVEARCRRVPVQHLLGHAAFRYLEVRVGPGVFVPRPETELLAGWGVDAARAAAGPGPVVVDLCSGSGAIALSVAHEVPTATVYAVETDPAALGWLRRNVADRAAAGDRPVEVLVADVTAPAVPEPLAGLRGAVDVVLCNPPYVPAAVAVPPEVALDPAAAVFGGPDGLAVVGPVVGLAAALLRPGGAVGIEHDDGHGAAVPALLARDGLFTAIADHPDLSGRPRFATALRASGRLAGRDALRLPIAD